MEKKLQEKIGKKLNVDSNQVVITNGAAFGIFLAMIEIASNKTERFLEIG